MWSPNNLLSDAMCKNSALYTSFALQQTSLLLTNSPSSMLFFFFNLVDEYILMAKEKHGYNVEQVRKQHSNTQHFALHYLMLRKECPALTPVPRVRRPSACCCGTSTTWSAHWPTWPTSRPSPRSGARRIRSCLSKRLASTARASTASSRW